MDSVIFAQIFANKYSGFNVLNLLKVYNCAINDKNSEQ
jgi:hypothetical protein